MRRLLAEMTWPDVTQAVANGMTTVILPLGATEQHGPHLPLGTDTFRAEALAERLASTLPDALVAPALPIGCSDEHSGFAGLLSLDHATLAGVIVNCARRMAAWGVRRLVLLSAHGGNGQALELAADCLSEKLPGLQIWVLGSSTTMSDALLAVAEAEGISAEAVGLHAGDGETSEMLCLRPDLVRMERIVPGYTGPMAEVMPRLLEAGLRPFTSTGTLGDASRADGRRGERYLAEQIESYRQSLTRPREAQQVLPSDAAPCA
jgi:mycofactocin precursor peptide peptidase